MKYATTLLSTLLAAAPLVSCHGSISSFVANGKTYSAPEPAEGNPFRTTSTPVRQLELLEPILDFTSSDNVCGRGVPPPATLIAPVKAGSDVSFTMRGGGGGPWPHEYGPVLFYLAKCPGTADKCDPTGLKWFKVDELGLKPGANNVWWHEELKKGNSLSGTIPAGIQNGDYLLRIEVMALHNAMNKGGAETSVACTQIRVTGGGNSAVPAQDLVTFPGAYSMTDKGILVDIWNGLRKYSFPGPALFKVGGGGSSPAPSTPKPAQPAESSKPVPSAPVNVAPAPSKPTAKPPSKACKRSRHRRRHLHRLAREMSHAH